ncbi:MAG: RDD family protein [Pseudomonadota bacterium]
MAPPLARRMACWLYEAMLLFGIAFAATLVFSIAGQMKSGMDSRRPILIGFLVIVFAIYFAWCWARGQTLAMRTWRIRVVDRNGVAPSQLRALFRYACCWLWVLPPIAFVAPLKLGAAQVSLAVGAWIALWALLSYLHPQRQFWHDALAGTYLVPAKD